MSQVSHYRPLPTQICAPPVEPDELLIELGFIAKAFLDARLQENEGGRWAVNLNIDLLLSIGLQFSTIDNHFSRHFSLQTTKN